MKSMLNVIRMGAGGLLCASLLAACADGRGTTGFKSYQYSKEEMTANKAAADAKAGKLAGNAPAPVAQGGPDDTQVIIDGGAGESKKDKDANAGDAGSEKTAQTEVAPEALDNVQYSEMDEEAKRKVMTEGGPQEPGQQVQVSVADLMVSNDEAVKTTKPVPQVAKLVKGITLTSNMADKQLLLNVDALVVIDDVDHTAHVMNAPMKYSKDGKMNALAMRLVDSAKQKDVVAGTKLRMFGNCKDVTCTTVQIRFSFEVGAARAAAVVGYRMIDSEWKLVESNIGEVKALDSALDSGKGSNPFKKTSEVPSATPVAGAAVEGDKTVSDAQSFEAQRLQEEQESFKRFNETKAAELQAKEKVEAPSVEAAAEAIGLGSATAEEIKLSDAQRAENQRAQEEAEAFNRAAALAAGVATDDVQNADNSVAPNGGATVSAEEDLTK